MGVTLPLTLTYRGLPVVFVKMRTLASTSPASVFSPPTPLPLTNSLYCFAVNACALLSPSLRAIRSAAFDPSGRLTWLALVAWVGAYFSYFGVPAYGSAKPVARVAACATPSDAASNGTDSAASAIAVPTASRRLTGAGSAAVPAVRFMALHQSSYSAKGECGSLVGWIVLLRRAL